MTNVLLSTLLLITLLQCVNCKFDKTKCLDEEYAEQHRKKCAKKTQKKATFDDWKLWSTKFPNCNPKKNPNQSPISINTTLAEKVNNELPLIVYSPMPQSALYFYTTEYNYDGVEIQAVNLHPHKESFRDITYIAGVGNENEYRYFQNALFLFTVSDLEPERSLHQIDGKRFLLEIVLTFADLPKSGRPSELITQIHVMVEKGKTLYPGWKFLEDGIVGLSNVQEIGIDSKDVLKEAKLAFEDASNKLKGLKEAEKRALNGTDNYADLTKDIRRLYAIVKGSQDAEKISGREELLKSSIQNLTMEAEAFKQQKTEITFQIQELKIKVKNLTELEKNETTKNISMLQSQIAEISKKLKNTLHKIEEKRPGLYEVSSELKTKQEILNKYRIGNMTDAQFRSVAEVKQKFEEFSKKKKEIDDATSDLSSAKDSLETIQSQDPRDVLLANSPFQISWLLPPTGGYYRYEGSSVVPPCARRSHVIVMANPITMSEEQFQAISKFTIKGRTEAELAEGKPPESMDKTVPVLRPLGARKVYYNPKNIQYKLDDGMHMGSSLRRKIKDSMRKSAAAKVCFNLYAVVTLLLTFITK